MAQIRLGSRTVNLPRNRIARVGLGVAFVLGGIFSILPVLGVWMLPVGLMILSVDFAIARRLRRRGAVAIARFWARRGVQPGV
ncbi:MAG: hypothetical protein JNM13_04780 [Hyphomicrobiaceae bacterium]|nr:hypothetical protein [Hyphomicrobiaceae bacterium]